ncbi:polysaccharide deacetylase family protein [Nocardioides sp.]|uniref:polysaccharide deacetylase family protein n=1 Tax=Nocardioides sp. TaxID=35761 RepID=UPI0039E4B0CC
MTALERSPQLTPADRIAYDPISKRPPLALPDGKKVAIWVIVNVEEWSIHETMPRTVLTPPAGGQPVPDIPNWAWHEYGNRVGFWRLLEILDSLSIKAVLAINGQAVDAYPDIAEAAIERGWEFIGHGLTQKNMQKVANETDDIAKTTATIAAATGRAPRGWLGPGLTETWETPDLLVEAGYEYVCDWVLDDQPVLLGTRDGGSIVSVPYTQECNDVAMMLIQHHPASEYERRAIDQFDQLLADAESGGSARVMALVLHPYIMGAPHRAKYVKGALGYLAAAQDAVFMTGEEILDWYAEAGQ